MRSCCCANRSASLTVLQRSGRGSAKSKLITCRLLQISCRFVSPALHSKPTTSNQPTRIQLAEQQTCTLCCCAETVACCRWLKLRHVTLQSHLRRSEGVQLDAALFAQNHRQTTRDAWYSLVSVTSHKLCCDLQLLSLRRKPKVKLLMFWNKEEKPSCPRKGPASLRQREATEEIGRSFLVTPKPRHLQVPKGGTGSERRRWCSD